MTRSVVGQLLSCVIAIVLGGCLPIAIEGSNERFEVASTNGPITLTFPIDNRGMLGERYDVSGVTAVHLAYLGVPPCTDTSDVYNSLALRIIDTESGRQLYERDLLEDPACHSDRLVWDGDDLVELEQGEPWPEDLYERPLPSPPPG